MAQYFGEEIFFNEDVQFFKTITGSVVGNVAGNLTGNVIGNVTGNLIGNVTGNLVGDVTGNIILSGISTFQDLKLNGKLFDGSSVFGAAGQILSSDGTKTSWINSSSANVGSATSVGVNLDSTNASRLITFVDTNSGNNLIKVDSDLTYNPSTNALTAGSFIKSGGTSSQFLKADGSVDSTTYATASSFNGTLSNTLTMNTSGTGLSGSATYNNGSATTFTITSNATSANTVSTIVARDSSGNFSAGTITGTSFIKSGGTSSQFLKADGSVDSNTYLTSIPSSIVAWVNFDGTGSSGTNQTIRASYNVSSVYKNSQGNYTVNYSSSIGSGNAPVSTCVGPYFVTLGSASTTSCNVVANEATVGPRDSSLMSVIVAR